MKISNASKCTNLDSAYKMNYCEKYKYLRDADKEKVSEIGIRALETFAGQDISSLQSQIATLEQ